MELRILLLGPNPRKDERIEACVLSPAPNGRRMPENVPNQCRHLGPRRLLAREFSSARSKGAVVFAV